MPEYVRVKSGYLRNGRVVRGGEVLDVEDPIAEGMPPSCFEPLTASVERATRRPGEVRMTPGTGPKADATVMAAQPAKRGSAQPRKPKA